MSASKSNDGIVQMRFDDNTLRQIGRAHV